MKKSAVAVVCRICNIAKNASDYPPRKSSPTGLRTECRSCIRASHKIWRLGHVEVIKDAQKKYYSKNKPKILASHKLYCQSQPDKVKATKRKWDLANIQRKSESSRKWAQANKQRRRQKEIERKNAAPGKYRKKNRNYYELNKQKCLERKRKWVVNNPEAARSITRNYRSLKRAGGRHTGEEIKRLFEKQRGNCVVCKISLSSGYHVDHIKPISKGGSNDIFNIQLLCPPCNLRKHNKDPIYFMQEMGFLL